MWTPWSGGGGGGGGNGGNVAAAAAAAAAAAGESSAMQQQHTSTTPPTTSGLLRQPPETVPSPAAGVGIPVSRESALQVVKLSLGFSALSGLTGAAVGVLKAQPAFLSGVQYAINTSTFAFPILAMREYVVTPMLDGALYTSRTHTDVSQSMHLHNVAASTISGAIGGGAMSAYFTGRAKLVPGAATFGLLCAGLQLTANELRILRIRFVAQRMRAGSDVETQSKPHGGFGTLKAEPQSDAYSAAAADRSATSTNNATAAKAWSWLPFRSMPDDEYEDLLQRQRDAALQQLRELDLAIEKEEAAQHKV